MGKIRDRRKEKEKAALAGVGFIGRMQYKKKKFDRKVKTFRRINKVLGKIL